ncbi:MAG: SRPBCC family protein [Thermoleophilia bacterium]|nr:SRPBCC family protein [Thermoleophilia bacterium]
MATYRATAKSPMNPEQTFEYLADFTNASEWDENTKSCDLVSGDALAEGAEYKVVTSFAGRDLTLTYRTVELERPGRIVFRSGTAIADIEDVITIARDGDGSKISYEATIHPKSVAKLLDPVFAIIFNRVGDRAAESLRETLASK